MSNQIYSNETEIYPILKTASYLNGKTSTEKYILVDTLNPSNGDILTITDDAHAGTLEDPLLASFTSAIVDEKIIGYRDNASLGLNVNTKTLVLSNDFGPLDEIQFYIQTDWEFRQGVVTGNETFIVEIEYVWDSGSVTAVINQDSASLGRIGLDFTYNIGTILDVPVGGSTINTINVYFDSTGTLATGTKTKGIMVLTKLT